MVTPRGAAPGGSQAGPWLYGDILIERVLDFDGPGLDPFVLLPDLTPEILERHRHWLEPGLLDRATGRLMCSFHSFVVRTPRSITRAPRLRENALTKPVQACTCTLG